MALVIRCSLSPSGPKSFHSPRLIPAKLSTQINQHHGKSDCEVILHSGMVKILKHASEVRWFRRSEKVFDILFEMDEVFGTSLSLLSKPNDSSINTWELTHSIGRRLLDFECIAKHVFAIQKMVPFTHPTKALFVLNALMLITPFEAVAETCEAGSSAFSMPLLLIVALIGATVGGASLQRQGKYKDAINYLSMVLAISKQVGDDCGNTEAYGAIADCYTELGDLEKAANFYDQYIATLESE